MCALRLVGTPTSHVSAWGGWLPAGSGGVPDRLVLAPLAAEAPVGGPLLLCLGGTIVAVHRMFGLLVCSVLRGSVGMHCIHVTLGLHQWGGSCTELPLVLSHNRMRAKFKNEHFLVMRRAPFLTRLD